MLAVEEGVIRRPNHLPCRTSTSNILRLEIKNENETLERRKVFFRNVEGKSNYYKNKRAFNKGGCRI